MSSRLLDQILGKSRETVKVDLSQTYIANTDINLNGDFLIKKDEAFIINEAPKEYQTLLEGMVKNRYATLLIIPENTQEEDYLTNDEMLDNLDEETLSDKLLEDDEDRVKIVPTLVDGKVADYSVVREDDNKKDKLKKLLKRKRNAKKKAKK